MNDKFNNSNEKEKNSNELLDDESTKPKGDHSKELKLGIGIFIGINIFMLILNQIFAETETFGFVAMLVNIFLLIYFSKYRKDVAGGMLTAFAILIVLTFIVAPIFWASLCIVSY
jgi:uncharacterized membrane protein YkgB